jgi:hypothetical protein
MTKSAEPSTPSGFRRNSTTKATDHELPKYDIFTRYGHRASLRFACTRHALPLFPAVIFSIRRAIGAQ